MTSVPSDAMNSISKFDSPDSPGPGLADVVDLGLADVAEPELAGVADVVDLGLADVADVVDFGLGDARVTG